jgi:hypothetical protein
VVAEVAVEADELVVVEVGLEGADIAAVLGPPAVRRIRGIVAAVARPAGVDLRRLPSVAAGPQRAQPRVPQVEARPDPLRDQAVERRTVLV